MDKPGSESCCDHCKAACADSLAQEKQLLKVYKNRLSLSNLYSDDEKVEIHALHEAYIARSKEILDSK